MRLPCQPCRIADLLSEYALSIFYGYFMAGKKRSSLEDVLDIAAHLPWLAGLALAALAYGVLHHFAAAAAAAAAPATGAPLAEIFQYLPPGVWLLVTANSFVRRRQPGKLPAEATPSLEPDVLERMSRQEFDAVVAAAFRREGYLVVERAGSRAEHGIDLDLFIGRERYLVQCRQWKEAKVNFAAVREFYRVISSEKAVGGFIVTSGRFTDEARRLALGRSIRLVPVDSLRTLLASGKDMTISPEFSRRRDDPVPPSCPKCGKAMMSRGINHGPRHGKRFWNCTSFPACRGSRHM